MSWQSPIIALLVASLVRPFVLVAGAWLLIRAFNLRHPSSRHAVWTAVLVGMLLLPAVNMLTPHWALPLQLPRRASAAAAGPAAGVMSSAFSWLDSPSGADLPTAAQPPATNLARPSNLPTAATAILSCYFVGLLVMLAYWAVGWIFLLQLLARSKRLRARWLRESADVSSPVTAGVFRPIVILPSGWRAWDANVREAVLTHEFAHIRRHDPLARALGRLAQWIFWFHPLAWWLARKTTNLAELACDAAVLERTSDPAGYSRALLDFAASVQNAGRRAALPDLAMARPGSELSRRIDQIFELSRNPLRNYRRPGLLLVLLGVPLLCLAATAGLAHTAPPPRAAAPPPQPTAPPPPPAATAIQAGQLAQAPPLEVAPNPNANQLQRFVIANRYTQPATEWILAIGSATANGGAPPILHHEWRLPAMKTRPALAPSATAPQGAPPGSTIACYAVIYADGASYGDPATVRTLIAARQRMLDSLRAATLILASAERDPATDWANLALDFRQRARVDHEFPIQFYRQNGGEGRPPTAADRVWTPIAADIDDQMKKGSAAGTAAYFAQVAGLYQDWILQLQESKPALH